MPFYAVLCCIMLYYAMLCYAALCCTMLCYPERDYCTEAGPNKSAPSSFLGSGNRGPPRPCSAGAPPLHPHTITNNNNNSRRSSDVIQSIRGASKCVTVVAKEPWEEPGRAGKCKPNFPRAGLPLKGGLKVCNCPHKRDLEAPRPRRQVQT